LVTLAVVPRVVNVVARERLGADDAVKDGQLAQHAQAAVPAASPEGVTSLPELAAPQGGGPAGLDLRVHRVGHLLTSLSCWVSPDWARKRPRLRPRPNRTQSEPPVSYGQDQPAQDHHDSHVEHGP